MAEIKRSDVSAGLSPLDLAVIYVLLLGLDGILFLGLVAKLVRVMRYGWLVKEDRNGE